MPKWCLYAWGANSHGQLGLGFQSEQCTLPRQVDLSLIGVDIRDIKKIIGGAGHTLILDKRGRVYSCGWNDRSQTGSGFHYDTVVLEFTRVNRLENERIKDIACGWNSSMALAENGDVYSWGSNSYGQLGINDSSDINYKEPERIKDLDERIKGISMGLRHSALVTEAGRVLVTGSGNKGQLGIADNENRGIRGLRAFTRISALKNVVEVACGQNHTAALTESGQIYTWGDNKYGQLGIDSTETKRVDYPQLVKIEKVAGDLSGLQVGWTHTSVFREDKIILAWGRNTYGQLGHREDNKNVTWMPKTNFSNPKFCQLSIGSEHNVAIAEDQSIYSWGWNEHGNCGDGSTRDVLEPKKVCIPHGSGAFLVGSGAGHSFAVVVDDT